MFSALNSGNANVHLSGYKMLGGVLGSIAFVSWLCTAVAALLQTEKFRKRFDHKNYLHPPVFLRAGLMLALTLLGGVSAAYCVRYGYAILSGLNEPVGLGEALAGLFRQAF